MVTADEIKDVQGGKALDSSGSKIGSIAQIYLDDRSGEPEWATVHTGLFGTSETFIPLQDAQVEGKDVKFPYSKDKVKDAPRVDADQHLDVEQEQELYKYYGVSYEGGDAAEGAAGADTAAVARGHQESDGRAADDTTHAAIDRDAAVAAGGPTTDRTDDHHRGDARAVDEGTSHGAAVGNDGTITRHEEQLHVGTETRESGRARLRKYVTTEEQTVSVPVSHEEVRVERVPVAEGTTAGADAFQESEHEVTLHEEVPVVTKEAHAVETVQLTTEQVSGEQQVTGQVRKEHIEVDGKDVGDRTE